MQRNTIFLLMLTLIVGGLALACADPAADAPDAVVSEAAPEPVVAAQPLEGTVYACGEGSKVGFVGSKVTGSHEGGFEAFVGNLTVPEGDLEKGRIELVIDTTSLWSDAERLTGHLKSAEFFDVETFPEAKFSSQSIAASEGGFTVTGNLELHGVTKEISFPATIELTDSGLAANAEFSINRFDFKIVYPGKVDDLIREEVLIKFDLVGTAEGA